MLERKLIGDSTGQNLPEIWFGCVILVQVAAGVPHFLEEVGHSFDELIWLCSQFRFGSLSNQVKISLSRFTQDSFLFSL